MYLREMENGKWGMTIDDIYSRNTEIGDKIIDFAQQRAKEMNIQITKQGKSYGKSPYTYYNESTGLTKQEQI